MTFSVLYHTKSKYVILVAEKLVAHFEKSSEGKTHKNLIKLNILTIMKKLSMVHFFVLFVLFGTATLVAQQLHTHSNAASINNEADSFSGWGGSATESSVSSEAYSGSYSIKLESPNNGWNYAGYSFSTTPDEQYVVSLYAKSASSSNPGIYWGGVVENQSVPITSTSWTLYTKTVTANGSTININIYPGTPALAGDSVFIDHVSIVPVSGSDTLDPTAPTLSSTAQTSTTADLSWIGATDNVGVTGYKVYRDGNLEATLGNVSIHQVTGLTASTTYSFTIRAVDAAANESPLSNTVSVTTNAGSGGGTVDPVWSESGSVASYTGDVAIGASNVPSGYKLAVEGKIRTREIRVDQDTWPDYVFDKDYDLPSLEEIKRHIDEKGHLPNIPSAQEVKENGVELGEMNRLLLEKIEELTIYLLDQRAEILDLKRTNQNLSEQLYEIEDYVIKNIKTNDFIQK